MLNRARLIPLMLVVLTSLIKTFEARAQTDQQMFIFQIDGNNYTKKSYNKSSQLMSSQLFKVGKVNKYENKYQLEINIYEYNKNGLMEDSSSTTFICKPSQGIVLMNVFPFADANSNKTVQVELASGDHIYPTVWKVGEKIDDHSYSLSIEGGLLEVVGTKSKIKVFNRQITKSDPEGITYTIASKVQIKSYMFGVNVNTLNFSIEEIINPKKGIIRQQFTEESGEYFIINLQNPQ
ncbi:MAG TPA: hypothetical protein PKH65_02825 [Bacteroidia bacterium]|nr:hypothetical protein [Bacteroidia bacterium]